MKHNPIQVLNGRVTLWQPGDGFKTSMDALMLAAACPVKGKETLLDLGCGVGSAGLCVLSRVPAAHLIGVDIQAESVDLARRNAEENDKTQQTDFQCTDIRDYRSQLVDHVICNPPFLEAGTHLISPAESLAKARGHQSEDINLQDWIDAGFHNLKQGGSLTIIHRADHTDKIVQAFGKRFGAIEMIPLWPKAGKPARRVIIRAIKNRKSPAIIHPGLVLHEGDGTQSKAAEKILRYGEPIAFDTRAD